MPKAKKVPLTAPRIAPAMGLYMKRKGFRAVEVDGSLWVTGQEDGEPFELTYRLFRAVARRYRAEELRVCERAVEGP